jgi:TRAP transporter TAXI family solute receptor
VRESRKILKVLSVLLVLCMVLVGCSSPANESSKEPSASETPDTSGDAVRLSLGTASVGGNYYVIGAGLAQIWNQYSDNIQVTSEATGGSGANVGLVNDNQVQFGLTSDNTMYNGYHGLAWAEGKKYQNIRTVAGLMPSALEIVVPKDSKINTIYDFENYTVTMGTSSGGGSLTALDLVNTLGVKWGKKVDIGWGDAVSNILDGLIDGAIDFASFPHAARTELTTNMECKWIELSEEDRQKMVDAYPYYFEGVMDPSTYKYLPEDGYNTIMTYNVLICNKDVDEDVVYELTKIMFENLEEWKLSSDAIKYVAEENILKCSNPIHPGALRYYLEKGYDIPKELYPPEYK